jgi:hypothetical protein
MHNNKDKAESINAPILNSEVISILFTKLKLQAKTIQLS